jgi:CRISPR-associated protein Csm4
MECYRLTFTAPFHIDSRGNDFYEESNSFIHSDTLCAAILATWASVCPEQIAQQAQAPSFKISSAFPFFKDHYFLPRVLSSQAIKLPEGQLKEAKKLKKIQWLDAELWKASLNDPNWAEQINLSGGICQGVIASKSQNMPEKLWIEEERPRLAIDRSTSQSSDGKLFNFSRIWFHQDGGLYFLAVFTDANSQKQFETMLSVLADSGIGADRTNGNGCFTWQRGKNPGLQLADHQKAVALSLVNPAPGDCQTGWLEGSAYKLISRGGWVGNSGNRKQRLRMFIEGSVFSQPLQGRIVDVSVVAMQQKVYRDGRGFFVKAG